MQLEELKARIETGLTNEKLQVYLDDAIDFVCGYLNVTFGEDNEMPNRVKRVIAKYVESDISFDGVSGVVSETIGGMTQTFESKKERDKALRAELKATGLRKLRW